jgi:hypothetical protein
MALAPEFGKLERIRTLLGHLISIKVWPTGLVIGLGHEGETFYCR